jgi:hypothetical protein
MGEVVPLEDPTNYRRVFQQIKKLWADGYVEILPHAQERMKEQGLDTTDLQHLIRYGRITDHSRPKDLWRYKIDGTSVDGAKTACLVEIDDNLMIVTVISPSKRSK